MSRKLLFLILGLSLFLFNSVYSWYYSGWDYRVPITIQERSGNNLTDYQVGMIVDTYSLISEGKMNPDCSDIRFTYLYPNGTEVEIPYWIEPDTCNTTNTIIWIKVPYIPANGNATVYMYYGNPNAPALNISITDLFPELLLSVDGPLGGRYSSGGSHTCVLLEDGSVACWGRNNYGQLGVGDTTNRITPVLVSNIGTILPKAVAITNGYAHTCVLLEDGRIACWGDNYYGQLGDGTTTQRTTPVLVSNIGTILPKAVAIAAGDLHTCALLANGSVACWGSNYHGQLGDGTTTNRITPVLVKNIGTTLPKAVAIALGCYYSCALLEDGRIACWGRNDYGQLGVGDTTNRATPVIVNDIGSTLPKALAVATGCAHTCALLEDGRIACGGL
jgi:Alpha-tubulin suppressor and related RCC1 domain-containing proteins